MTSRKNRTPAEGLAAYACTPLPVTAGTCAMCRAAGVPVIPLGTYQGAPSQCADGKACLDRLRALAGH